MILDFGASYYRRYWADGAQYLWVNGAPGGGALPVTRKGRYRGMTRNVGRLLSRK